MGYSIMTLFKTDDEKNKMKAFLEEHYREFKEITKDIGLRKMKFDDYYEFGPPTEDMSYGPSKSKPLLGFNYGAGTDPIDRSYKYAICYWMAIHSQVRRKGRPLVLYDGSETWILFVDEKRPEGDHSEGVEVNKHGYRKLLELEEMKRNKLYGLLFRPVKKDYLKMDDAIKKELERLSLLWEQVN